MIVGSGEHLLFQSFVSTFTPINSVIKKFHVRRAELIMKIRSILKTGSVTDVDQVTIRRKN